MYQVIDTATSDLYYDQLTQLDGAEYLFAFLWSTREGCWYLTVGDQDGNPIAQGIKLVVDWNLLGRFRDPRLPPGLLLCSDQTGQGADIALPGDLGTRVLLTYVTADDPALTGIAA